MRRGLRLVLVGPIVLALAAVCAPANAADTVVAELRAPSQLRDYAGIQVFSAFDGSAYRLAIRRAGKVQVIAVAPSPTPFDADIGPDRSGRPQLAYTRCRRARVGCDLFVVSLAAGATERPVRGGNTSQASEVAPTVWKGRIAFARVTPGQDKAVVYTRNLDSARRSERLPAFPQRFQGHRTISGDVVELELYRDTLAQITTFDTGRTPAGSEVRLVDVSDRTVRQVSRVSVGEGGQYFTGLGFADGHLGWAFDWIAGGASLIPGIYRYQLSTGKLARADFSPLLGADVAGLAMFSAHGAYMIDAQFTTGGCGETLGERPAFRPCQFIRSDRLDFRPRRTERRPPTRANVRRPRKPY